MNIKKIAMYYAGYEVLATAINYFTKSTIAPSLLTRVVFPSAYVKVNK